MTRNEVIANWDVMTARERDAWVTEVVFGWDVARIKAAMDAWRGGVCGAETFPYYTTKISAAWAVNSSIGDCLHLREHGSEGEWEASYCGLDAIGHGETAQEAICLAAVIAKLSV